MDESSLGNKLFAGRVNMHALLRTIIIDGHTSKPVYLKKRYKHISGPSLAVNDTI